jgi:hypothetical protein
VAADAADRRRGVVEVPRPGFSASSLGKLLIATGGRTIQPEVVEKLERYRSLVGRMKACRRCSQLVNPADLDGGSFDSDEVGPCANWQGNLDATVLVIGQDFADQDTFRKLRGWPGSTVATNLALVELAGEAGFNLRSPVLGQPDDVLLSW